MQATRDYCQLYTARKTGKLFFQHSEPTDFSELACKAGAQLNKSKNRPLRGPASQATSELSGSLISKTNSNHQQIEESHTIMYTICDNKTNLLVVWLETTVKLHLGFHTSTKNIEIKKLIENSVFLYLLQGLSTHLILNYLSPLHIRLGIQLAIGGINLHHSTVVSIRFCRRKSVQ